MADAYPGFIAQYALETDPFILHYPSDELNANMQALLNSEYFNSVDWPMLLSGCPLLLTVSADTLLGKLREVEQVFRQSLATVLSRKYFKTSFLTQLLTWHPGRLRLKIERLKEVLPPDVLSAALAKDPTVLSLDTRQVARVLKVIREVAQDRALLGPSVAPGAQQPPESVAQQSVTPTFSFEEVDRRLARLAEEPLKWEVA